jgi:DNA ligase D-like protein (predicted ligase)
LKDNLKKLSESARKKARQVDQPSWMDPMLASLTDQRFSDENWIFERKLDGERCIAYKDGDSVSLKSRNRKVINDQYPELVEALEKQAEKRFIVDGEIVAFEDDVTSFSRLQNRMHMDDPEEIRQTGVDVYYYLFDILYFDKYDVTEINQRVRKSLLKKAVSYHDPVRYMIHRNTDGEKYYQEACQKGWEGIIAKKAISPYVHRRSKNWLKFKCINQQEFVIGGFTEPHGERIGFGALLLGYYDGDDLLFAGKVGTGFDNETLQRLKDELDCLERKTPPFVKDDLPKKEIHWVMPKLVAEIGFEEWTQDNKLRQPRFLGLRREKDAEDVVREEPSV